MKIPLFDIAFEPCSTPSLPNVTRLRHAMMLHEVSQYNFELDWPSVLLLDVLKQVNSYVEL